MPAGIRYANYVSYISCLIYYFSYDFISDWGNVVVLRAVLKKHFKKSSSLPATKDIYIHFVNLLYLLLPLY